jgi:uncharacterized hydrophobic protein (TIGR00271 family)
MLHLRLITPPDCTAEIVDLLRCDRAVATVAVVSGAAIDPPGDLLLVDVAREEASAVLELLEPFGVRQRGAIALEQVQVALSSAAERAERDSPGDPADAVVWEDVRARTSEDSTLSWSYIVFLLLATVIAAVAIIVDSAVLLVGAMVVGPEFGPLAGLAVATVQGRPREATRSLAALLVGFVVAIVVTAVVVWTWGLAGLLGDVSASARSQTAFIARPDVWSVIVASLAGVAGMLSLTSAKSSVLIGVLVSVSTVPAAAGMAVALATGDRGDALGSGAQLVVNLVALFVASVLVLVLQRARDLRIDRGAARRRRPETDPA